LKPFYDSPDVTIDWLFYAVPEENGYGPATIFTDRFWDDRENWLPAGPGVVPHSTKPYFGPVPGPELSDVGGSPDLWANGLSYATYLAGGYPDPGRCVVLPAVRQLQLRELQSVQLFARETVVFVYLRQRQSVLGAGVGLLLSQRQQVTAGLLPAVTVAQAGQVVGRIATPVSLLQAQVIPLAGVVSSGIAGAQQVTAASSVSAGLALVRQKQQVNAQVSPQLRRRRPDKGR
jgi:hypothetical protein